MKALIIEDEELIAQELIEKLRIVAPDLEVIEVLPSLKAARRWFASEKEPDILFMDIQLSDGVSFKILEEFQLHCPIVFTTAYDEYAIRAFRVNSVDYLLKPIENDDLSAAIEKCRAVLESRQAYPDVIRAFLESYQGKGAVEKPYKEKFMVQSKRQWFLIDASQIAALERNVLIYLYTRDGEKHILDAESMDQVEELLDPNKFYRANRQWVIHIDAVNGIRQQSNLKLEVSLKPPLKLVVDVSREKAPAFKRCLDR